MTTEKMDMLTAKVEAANASRKEKKTIYILVDNEGDCILKHVSFLPKHETIAAYRNGAEVPLDDEQETPAPTKTKTMAVTKAAAKPAKKAAAVPEKKAAPVKNGTAKSKVKPAAKGKAAPAKPVKEPTGEVPKGGKVQELKMKEIVALMLKGTRITSMHGALLSVKAIKARQNQDKLRRVIVLPAAK